MKQYERKDFCQWGESGVIDEIFNRICVKNNWLVDVGAWDGAHFSNTAFLRLREWNCILAEADEERRAELSALRSSKVNVFGRVRNIDSMLFMYDIPTDFDLLSIDVDGDDYYLWEAMVKYKPRVVVIEYNQTVPPHVSIVQERGGSFGASFRALKRLGEAKGYIFVHATVTNLIFVLDELWYIPIHPVQNTDWLQYVVTGYNGKQYLIGEPAHNDNQGGKHEKLIANVKYREI